MRNQGVSWLQMTTRLMQDKPIITEGNAMTTHHEAIYSRYRKADFTDRLNIYLQFPELRNDFLAIEQTETPPNFFETAKPLSKRRNLIDRLINRSFSFLL